MSRSSGQRPWLRGSSRLWLGALAVVVAAAVLTPVLTRGSPLSARDRRWQHDIAYLASGLPRVHIRGLGSVRRPVWEAAASRLEEQVPQLSDGQLVVGLARIVAMLHDDETELTLPRGPSYPLLAQWVGSRLYLIAVPSASRALLGSRLVAVDGHPISHVLAQLRSVIDYQDPGVLRAGQAADLTNAMLLYWLGITHSQGSAAFTVRTTSGRAWAIRVVAGPPAVAPGWHRTRTAAAVLA